MKVSIVKTPLTVGDMAKVLADAYPVVFPSSQPTADELAWLLALARHENANGEAIIQHNWGNRIALASDDYWVPAWADESIPDNQLTERLSALRSDYRAGNAVPGKFAAWKSHRIGAEKFLELFRTVTNARILTAARDNDADAFHRAVSLPHPETAMAYCPDCTSGAVRAQYAKLKEDSLKYFVNKYPKAVEGEQAASSSLPLPSPPTRGRAARSMPVLRRGDAGPAVVLLQIILGAHADGQLGPSTEKMIIGLQRREGIEIDGVVGPETWRVIFVQLGDRLH